MELKHLNEYTERELFELIVSNQVRLEQRLHKIYSFLSEKYTKEFHKHNEHKDEAFEEFLDSFSGLNRQINKLISERKD